jgi:hypothetical protein
MDDYFKKIRELLKLYFYAQLDNSRFITSKDIDHIQSPLNIDVFPYTKLHRFLIYKNRETKKREKKMSRVTRHAVTLVSLLVECTGKKLPLLITCR